jgi:hypothetical protein
VQPRIPVRPDDGPVYEPGPSRIRGGPRPFDHDGVEIHPAARGWLVDRGRTEVDRERLLKGDRLTTSRRRADRFRAR